MRQSTVSESTLVAMLAARKAKIAELKSSDPGAEDAVLASRLVAYASDQVSLPSTTLLIFLLPI